MPRLRVIGEKTMSKALYRKHRSKSLDEVIGQRHITDILSRAISDNNVSHAYLLTGPRGVGKTSVARIMAYAINELPYNDEGNNLDIIEIDAASNNGVEDVRDLREKVQIAPFAAKKKIYIIDEVHMLSKAAFNALLKTIEEPPTHVVFIMATTNIEKIPATIVSRAQRFSFRPISVDDAVKHLAKIAKTEGIKISKDALQLVAERGDGSFRDSISLLDQLSNLLQGDTKEITTDLIEDLLGLAPNEMINQILEAVESHDTDKLITLLNRSFNEGTDSAILVAQLTTKIRQKIGKKPQLLSLLDPLIDVAKSPQPQLKLLSTLGLASLQKPVQKTAALLAPPLGVSASIAELKKQALLDKPYEKNMNKTEKVKKSATQPFYWEKLIEYTKRNYICLYSVLSKCDHILKGNKLTLYTNNKFYKMKLDDIKYSSQFNKCLQEMGVYGLNVHTIATSLPLSVSQVATVTAIMGGGEEVSLESA
jgi:DNA polymerase-3 subunit gamma/tau